MSLPNLFLLNNAIKDYAWGDSRRLQQLFGIENPHDVAQAEIWMGAHPADPSLVEWQGEQVRLDDLIATDPVHFLGQKTAQRFQERLPFLFKVLNAGQPLSIQLHPDKPTAERGFADEQARGVPLDAPTRNYADANHKPELICALTPFRALCGFRPVADICEILALLDAPQLTEFLPGLRGAHTEEALQALCLGILQMPEPDLQAVLRHALDVAAEHDRADLNELCLLHEYYPGDRGVLFALLLNRVELQPGEALFLGAGNMHSYLDGVGLEIMANSDNVIRGGLTPKHVDCDELVKLAHFVPLPEQQLRVSPVHEGAQTTYPTPVDDFAFASIDVTGIGATYPMDSCEILLCVSGALTVHCAAQSLALEPGQSCFVCAAAGEFAVVGEGRLARAAVSIP